MFDWTHALAVTYFICAAIALISMIASYGYLRASALSFVILRRLRAGKHCNLRWSKKNDLQMGLVLLACGACPILNALLGVGLIKTMLRPE